MKTAVVILNWNGAAMLRRFLPSVLQHTAQVADIIVADNASTDGSVEMLKAEFPSVRIITLDKNYGFADGYNMALRQVDAEYYVLLNSDVEVTPQWLVVLQDYMDAHPDCAACQPKLLSESQRDRFEYAGASGGFLDRYGYPFCRGRIFDVVERDGGQYDTPLPVLWATGACLMVRSKDYWEAGALDGRFFAHNEEIDLCWRLRIMGRSIFCLPASHVYHVGGGTLPKGNPRKTYLNFRNNLTMLYKNLPERDLRHVMRVRRWLDYVAAVQTLVVNRNVGDFKAILRARRDFHAWLPQFRADRERIQQSRCSDGSTERSNFLLLWQYYVCRRRRYAQLPVRE